MSKTYRRGAIGALMDEYERAAGELRDLVARIPAEDFSRAADPETRDEHCRSVQTIMSHVVGAGYAYAGYIRDAFSIPTGDPARDSASREESLARFDEMLAYTARTLDGRWEMPDEEITATVIETRWGVTYDLEQLLEHAIVHILRHRRQIERFIHRGAISALPRS